MKRTNFILFGSGGRRAQLRSRWENYVINGQPVLFGAVVLSVLLCFTSFQADGQCTLSCNNNVQVSLNVNGQATILPQMVLSSPTTGCGPLTTDVFSGGVNVGNVVNCAQINQTLTVRVRETSSGNLCWGSIVVKDYYPPSLTCTDKYVICSTPTDPQVIGYPAVSDNCSQLNNSNLIHTDNWTDLDCNTLINGHTVTAKLERNWSTTDASGNSASCTQYIYMERATLTDVAFPANHDGLDAPILNCTQNPDDLNLTGVPTVNGIPLDNTGYCELIVSHTDQTVNICSPGGYKILRQWQVVDWCTNTFVIHIQIIKVLDTTPPVISCPANVTMGTSTTFCGRSVQLPQATATDNCSGVSISAQWAMGSGFGPFPNVPKGSYTITYKATDGCNNQSTCSMNLAIVDDDVPIPVCDEQTDIILDEDGLATVQAPSFDDGSQDNCGVDHFKVRRPGLSFDSSVPFSCSDIGNTPITVTLRVYDEAGNHNDCTVQAFVKDKTPPVIACPPEKHLSCGDNYSNTVLTGTATATDNCAVGSVVFTDSLQLNACHEGLILRTWKATDGAGFQATCIQSIYLQDNTPVTVTFPADYTTYNCGAATDPAVTGQPMITGNDCETVNVTFTDQIFNIAAPACYKIVRKWEVIDWCHYSPNTNPGAGNWNYTQIIKVLDNTPPVITCPANMTVGILTGNCTTFVNVPAVSATDCNPTLTYSNNSSYANTGGANASGVYPKGVHTVSFTAQDGCGNFSSCQMSITVYDAKPPTPVCVSGITIPLGTDSMITITPAMIETGSSSDNCTPYNQLVFQVQPSQFSCANTGANTVKLIATDEAGNTSYCNTIVTVQDNMGMCAATASISGTIYKEDGVGIKGAAVKISGDVLIDDGTDAEGKYALNDLAGGNTYTVIPQIDENYLNGVTTLDMILVRKHILGLALLDTPYKMIAADVNKSGTITAFDLVQMQKLILNVTLNYPSNKSWRFVDAAYNFANPANPFASAFPETITLNNLNGNATEKNFIGIKIGDVNGSANPLQAGTRNEPVEGTLNLVLDDWQVEAGKQYNIPFRVRDFKQIEGFQFTLRLDPDALQYLELEPGVLNYFNGSNFGLRQIDQGILTTSWDDPQGGTVSLDDDAVLFTINAVARKDGRLSSWVKVTSDVTRAEAYNERSALLDVQLVYDPEKGHKGISLYQNYPNPFDDVTYIGVNLPKAVSGVLTITDELGRVLKTIERDFPMGYSEIEVRREDLPYTSGIYFYYLQTPVTRLRSGKMILMH